MKKVLVLVFVCALLVAVLAGCGAPVSDNGTVASQAAGSSAPAASAAAPAANDNTTGTKVAKEDMYVGFSLYSQTSPYFGAMMASIEKKCKELGIKFTGLQANDDLNKQISDIEDLLAKGIKVLILNPKDPEALKPSVTACKNAGVPVIIIDNPMPEDADYTCLVTSDNYKIGQLVGEYTAKMMAGKEVKIGMLSGQPGSLASDLRRTGFTVGYTEANLKANNSYKMQVLTQGWGAWGTPQGQKAFEDMLSAFPDINLLVAENDAMAIGALQVIEEQKLQDKITVVACADGQKEAYQLIKEGKYLATGLNDPALAAATAVDVGVKLMNGEKVDRTIYTKAACINKDNVDEFYKADAIF
jgi:ribose transport system substrate-binding protein